MTDEIDAATEYDVIVPELWSKDILAYTYQEGQVLNRVTRVDGAVAAYGDTLHMPAMPVVTIADVTATTGAVANSALTLTNVSLVVNQWRHATVTIVDKAQKQAIANALEGFKTEFKDALVADIESKILGLYSDISTYTQGDSSSNANEDLLTAAVNDLLTANLGMALRDPNRVSFVFHTSQWQYVKKVDSWNNANLTGESAGGAIKFAVPSLYGIPTFFNSTVASSGNARQNMLFCKEALALGVQENITFEELPKSGLARVFSCHVLYGVKARAEARACLIKTKA